jgi:hypothetical protein
MDNRIPDRVWEAIRGMKPLLPGQEETSWIFHLICLPRGLEKEAKKPIGKNRPIHDSNPEKVVKPLQRLLSPALDGPGRADIGAGPAVCA